MFLYLTKRIILALFTLFVIMLISYFLMRLAPGDPTRSNMFSESGGVAGQKGAGLSTDKGGLQENDALRRELHLDEPILVGFSYWLKGILLHGDFGRSVAVDKGRTVLSLLKERLPITLTLNIWSISIIYTFSILLGIYATVYQGSMSDKAITFVLFFLYSLPGFWVALVLQVLFCEGGTFPIFPLRGLGNISATGLSTWEYLFHVASYYVLPIFCLSYAGFAGLSRYTRSGMLDVIKKDYIRTARAKGVPERVVIFKHAFRNALIILITLFAGLLPGLIAGSIIIEQVFSIPGMGKLSMMALTSRDYPVLMTLFLFGGALTLGGILLSDILYVLADPRITFKSR